MSCVDLTEQFLSYVETNPHQSSYWHQPAFMKSCSEALSEIKTLTVKVKELENNITRNRLSRNKEQQSKMLINVKENIKVCETHLKRLALMPPDMKTSNQKFAEEYKNSIVATLQMKLLQVGLKLKQVYTTQSNRQEKKGNSRSPPSQQGTAPTNTPNISRSLFLEQSQEEVMEEIAANEYRDIEQSFGKISEMYKETLNIVRMHEFMIDSIVSNIDEAEGHVDEGRKQLSEAHKRQSKNRPLIFKVFITLYVLVFVYIVILS